MSSAPFVSFAAKSEHLVPHRAIKNVGNARYAIFDGDSDGDSAATCRAFDTLSPMSWRVTAPLRGFRRLTPERSAR